MMEYLDAQRPGWRTEPIADLVAWTHEAAAAEYRRLSDGELRIVVVKHDIRAACAGAVDDVSEVMIGGQLTGITTRALAREVLSIADRGDGLDMANVDTRDMLPLLVAAGLMPQAASTALTDAAKLPARQHWQVMGGELEEQDPNRATMLEQARA